MKKNFLTLFSIAVLSVCLSTTTLRAATYTIEASDFQFSPDTINLLVGDTVKWIWLNGNHTTTANGIPEGAAPWNTLLDSLHTNFTYIVTAEGIYHYISVPDLPGMQGEFTATFPVGISSLPGAAFDFNIVSNIIHENLSVNFSIPVSGRINITLCDLMGRRLQTMLDENRLSGKYNENLLLRDYFPAGMYFVSIRYNDAVISRRILIQ